MRLSFYSFLLLAVPFFLSACVEQVDLESFLESKPTGRLVVEGLITDERKHHTVKLSRTGKALPDDSYAPVSDAEVSITDGTFVYLLTEDTLVQGTYYSDSISGEVNKTYTLRVVVDGMIYEASDTLVAVTKFGRADGIKLGSSRPPKGYINTPLIVFGSNAPAMVTIQIDNPRTGDKYTHLDYYTFPGVHPDDLLPKPVEATLAYDQGTQITQKKYSLSDAHYRFLRAMLLETEYKGGIFGSVRANVPTNLSNGALGFFGACERISRTGTIGNDGQLH